MRTIVEVTGPAPTQDLTVLATAKDQMGIVGTALDTKIQNWIKQASDAIASHCNRVFGKETLRQTFFLDGEFEALVLERYPVEVVTSVTVDGVLSPSTDYSFDKKKSILVPLVDGYLNCWNARKVVVEYRAGYALLTELPYDLESACLKLVANLYSQSTRDPLAKRIEVPGVETVDYWVGATSKDGELPNEVLTMIKPYVSHRL